MKERGLKTVSDWVGFSIFSTNVFLALCCLSYALVLIARQKKRKVSDIMVMHLCACELVAVIFGYCRECLYYWNLIQKGANTIPMLIYTTLYVSVYQSTMVIVLDRVLAVYLVLKYKVVVTKNKLVIVYIVLWLISIATGVLTYFTHWSYWLFWDTSVIIIIASSYMYIIITVYRRRRAMSRNNPHLNTPQLKLKIPLLIVSSFVLTFLIPDMIVILNYELYCIWFEVSWSLNWISDPLIYVIFTKLQKKKNRKNQI